MNSTTKHRIRKLVTLEDGNVVRLIGIMDSQTYVGQQQDKVVSEDGTRYVDGHWSTMLVSVDSVSDRNGYCPWHAGGEPEARECVNPHDHCRHGVYVGGCGIDWMCGACELGDDDA